MLSSRPSLARLARRRVHTGADDVRPRLRQLLRETAQSVAVAVVRLPAASESGPFHGATLSSFSSVALDPFPLVAFSLRVPSRLASALNARAAAPPSAAHLVVNVLSAAQPDLADRFARADVYPRPFEDPRVRYTLSPDGLPVLAGALGALTCRLVGPSWPLARLCGAHDGDQGGGEEAQQASGGMPSELFIARVLRVERIPAPEDPSALHRLPLVYHRRRYTTVEDHPES